MSRAINLNATESHVIDTCAKLKVAISTIEALRSGGTRVVLKNSEAAADVRRSYGNKVITGAVRREPTRLMHY